MNAAFSRFSRTAALLAISGLVITGCGTTADTSPAAGEATETKQAPVAEPTTAVTGSGTLAGTVINGLPTKKEIANDGKGEYIQTTISPDDPAMNYNPAIVESTATDRFSEADIREAQKMLVTFIAEEVYDSTLNGNPNDHAAIDRWFASHADLIAPEQFDIMLNEVKNDVTMHPVMRGTHREGYELAYGPDTVHVLDRDITVTKIQGGVIDGYTVLGVDATGSVTHAVQNKGSQVAENTTPDLRFTLIQAGGKWVIAGFQNSFHITPVQ